MHFRKAPSLLVQVVVLLLVNRGYLGEQVGGLALFIFTGAVGSHENGLLGVIRLFLLRKRRRK